MIIKLLKDTQNSIGMENHNLLIKKKEYNPNSIV